MCNPRKVIVDVVGRLQESWDTTISEQVELGEEVRHIERRRTRIPVHQYLGDLALETLEELIRESGSGWEESGDFYRQVEGFPDVGLYYLPKEQCFETRAWASENVQIVGSASREVHLSADEEIRARGEGHYDSYFNENEQDGRRKAKVHGEKELEKKAREHKREFEKKAKASHQEELSAKAAQDARRRLGVKISITKEELQTKAKQKLENALPDVCREISRFLTRVYVRSLEKLAKKKGGRVVRDVHLGGDVEEFTIAIPYS